MGLENKTKKDNFFVLKQNEVIQLEYNFNFFYFFKRKANYNYLTLSF